jgi:hypothetical protein
LASGADPLEIVVGEDDDLQGLRLRTLRQCRASFTDMCEVREGGTTVSDSRSWVHRELCGMYEIYTWADGLLEMKMRCMCWGQGKRFRTAYVMVVEHEYATNA